MEITRASAWEALLVAYFSFWVGVASAQEDLPRLIKNVQPSVVTISVYDNTGRQIKLGTGFFVNWAGDVVTNSHVIQNAASIVVKTLDGRSYAAKTVIAKNEEADIALLSINIPSSAVRPLHLTHFFPEVGERVIVIGSPLGLDQTVSDGIVSAIRNVQGIGKIIQITAPISPGSSGSPVLNMMGRVIGVATLQLSEGQNLNFAIPSEMILLTKKTAIPTGPAGTICFDSVGHVILTNIDCQNYSSKRLIEDEVMREREKLEKERKRSEEERRKADTGKLPSQEAEEQYQFATSNLLNKDYAEAAWWYRKAANQGHAEAQHILGMMHAEGQGLTQNYGAAVKWYRKAADQGYAEAQTSLGVMYEKGRGVTQDYGARSCGASPPATCRRSVRRPCSSRFM